MDKLPTNFYRTYAIRHGTFSSPRVFADNKKAAPCLLQGAALLDSAAVGGGTYHEPLSGSIESFEAQAPGAGWP
jgi:hypothetical protein